MDEEYIKAWNKKERTNIYYNDPTEHLLKTREINIQRFEYTLTNNSCLYEFSECVLELVKNIKHISKYCNVNLEFKLGYYIKEPTYSRILGNISGLKDVNRDLFIKIVESLTYIAKFRVRSDNYFETYYIIKILKKSFCDNENVCIKNIDKDYHNIMKNFSDGIFKSRLKRYMIDNLGECEIINDDKYSKIKDVIVFIKDKMYKYAITEVSEQYENNKSLKKKKERNILNKKTYLIKNNRNNFYKIGRSVNPLKRFKTLSSEEPDLLLIKTWKSDMENELHEDYKKYRIRGEWFDLTKIQVKYICTHY